MKETLKADENHMASLLNQDIAIGVQSLPATTLLTSKQSKLLKSSKPALSSKMSSSRPISSHAKKSQFREAGSTRS